MRGRRLILAGVVIGLGAAVALQAQGFRRGGFRGVLREGLPEKRGAFTFCRLMYTSVVSERNGQGWWTDYPAGDANFMYRLDEMTYTHASRWEDGQLAHAVVRATDDEIFSCPFLFASDVGTMGLDREETARLREYLLKGGFLWADDFWGTPAWEHWQREIGRVLPEYTIVELPLEHPIFSTAYPVRRIPQVPSINFWLRSGGATSERGRDSEVATMHAIFDDQGRMLVLMSHNTDIADGWEREGESQEFFFRFSPESYAVGLNVALWVLTH